jgi:hypothetical protein
VQLSIKERSPIEFKSPPDPSRQVEEVDEERKFLDGSLSVEKMEAGKYENRKIGTHPISTIICYYYEKRGWVPFVQTYRTLCIAPKLEMKAVFNDLRQFGLAT